MSITTAMAAGVSGLRANSSAMAVISDNIANVNTVGYKRSLTDFSALVNAQNRGTTHNAGGVTATTRTLVSAQGSLNQTASTTDLALSGQGFFVVAEAGANLQPDDTRLFTRAGNFTPDGNGFLRNAGGMYLLGWPVDPTTGLATVSATDLSRLQPISTSGVGAIADATTTICVNANLSSIQPAHGGAYAAGDLAAGTVVPHFERPFQVYDSQGGLRTMTLGFLKTGPNTWAVEAYVRPATDVTPANGLVGSFNMTFDANGNFLTPSAPTVSIPWTAALGVVTPQPVALDFDGASGVGGMTQFASGSVLISTNSDGVPPGTVERVSVGTDGVITGLFSNGLARPLWRIPIATFVNPDGMTAERGGTFRPTLDSGQLVLNPAGEGQAGRIQAGSLEASTVDLATEFTGLITTQRAYSAASRIITTADEMLAELIQIKR